MSIVAEKIKTFLNYTKLNLGENALAVALSRAEVAERRADEAESNTVALQSRLDALNSPPKHPPPLVDASLSGWFKHETGELIEGFKIDADDIVLDIGCGDSPFLEFCANQKAEVIFADIDEEKVNAMAERLAQTPAKAVTPLVTDSNPIPLADGTATKVIAMEVLEHVDDPALFLAELVRVGKPGSLYLITVPDPVAETLQKFLAPDSYFMKPNHVRIIQRDQFAQWIEDAGLVIETKKSYGFYWSMWWMFFWACKQDLNPPWHPLLESWSATWGALLSTDDGARIKKTLDDFMPKSQAIIARKPY
ncbi:MAG: class I SAM-dependent methyltransferase [Pseudomonadales bacterium]|nr:class I SAM-dependent methyltransferase [Pseudomonadales bacterium]